MQLGQNSGQERSKVTKH